MNQVFLSRNLVKYSKYSHRVSSAESSIIGEISARKPSYVLLPSCLLHYNLLLQPEFCSFTLCPGLGCTIPDVVPTLTEFVL